MANTATSLDFSEKYYVDNSHMAAPSDAALFVGVIVGALFLVALLNHKL